MKLGIMQPYFLPYIGYFQLIAAVDLFIIYDNIKYTKKGWINRNRILKGGGDSTFSLPLRGASDQLEVVQRRLADNFNQDKLLNQFKGAYSRAPEFQQVYPVLERIVRYDDTNLFRYIRHSVEQVCAYLEIRTPITNSSEIAVDAGLKGQARVLALCEAVGADTYLNLAGGIELYSKEAFRINGVSLKFIRARPIEYQQFGATFVPSLSIIDVLMFNERRVAQQFIYKNYELI